MVVLGSGPLVMGMKSDVWWVDKTGIEHILWVSPEEEDTCLFD